VKVPTPKKIGETNQTKYEPKELEANTPEPKSINERVLDVKYSYKEAKAKEQETTRKNG